MWILSCKDGERTAPPREQTAPEEPSPRETSGSAPRPSQDRAAPKEKPAEHAAVSRKYFDAVDLPPLSEPATVAPLEKGSVLLLVFDALNARHLGIYGYERDTSPTIDKVAREGLVLTNHISNSSWTRPSFTTIVTGLPKKGHGVELEGGWRLEPHVKTLAERFRNAGYRTAGFTGNPLVRKAWGFDQGYQTYEDPLTLGVKAFPMDSILINNAIRWLEGVKDRPFFLVLFLTSAHPPYRPPRTPRRFLSEVPPGDIIEHPFKEYPKPLRKDEHARIVAAYDDEIAYLDQQVARLLDHMRAAGQLDRTVIAMTADHGEMFGQHNCYLHVYHMWEQTLRVPLILKAPNLPVKGAADSRFTTHVDIAPTLLDFVGIPYDDSELKGTSLKNTLADLSRNQERPLFSQYNAHGIRRQAVRNGRWKLIHHHKVKPWAVEKLDELHPLIKQPDPRSLPSLAWKKERYELYNLLEDRDENTDLFEARRNSPELEALMRSLAPEITGDKAKGALTEEMVQALINAGYLTEEKAP